MEISQQVWLLQYQNPLDQRFGREFFRSIPQDPGVYVMRGEHGQILYIGKAKNLRNRIQSYVRAKPDQVSRKVLRMVSMLRAITWEICETETQALLTENRLLREHRPPFNVVNTSPESYLFLGLEVTEQALHFGIGGNLSKQDEKFVLNLSEPHTSLSEKSDSLRWRKCEAFRPKKVLSEVFGVYKGKRLVREGYGALLRLLWGVLCFESKKQGFEFPGSLTRYRSPRCYSFVFRDEMTEQELQKWLRSLRRFLKGISSSLISQLSEALLEISAIPPFLYHRIQDDLECLSEFYQFAAQRSKRVRLYRNQLEEYSHLSQPVVLQEEIDDLLVLMSQNKKERACQ